MQLHLIHAVSVCLFFVVVVVVFVLFFCLAYRYASSRSKSTTSTPPLEKLDVKEGAGKGETNVKPLEEELEAAVVPELTILEQLLHIPKTSVFIIQSTCVNLW